ncbi:CHAT domain-containing protein [Candidatus Thiodictyon syntrophicum]|jgi:tetratricopeptide (TPR) repeat protein|uniref:CHAT domain-containing protein n=1 Tax=Candidatus Thiodictyon syntrophicum TaxID=1166950 RepID=A0A2K8UDX2_9GAMM|nr:CHAT domain-containing protein [Candidatus Thiodictyon syntrophicum]AUB83639.1 hypothetical protein THSYN_23600 [Candidatus Thiodictyon syntrophicum]
MAFSSVLHIRQADRIDGHYPIRLRLRCPDQPDLEAEARITFALTPQEQEDLRWYLEDYLQNPGAVEPVQIAQIESMLHSRGEDLYRQVLTANPDTQAIWFAIRNQLADLRIEIASGISGAAAIPWELMRDPALDCAIALRVRAFVRVQSNPSLSFIPIPPLDDGRIRLLYCCCRPNGTDDVGLRAVANRLLQGLGEHRPRFAIRALRPPTYEQLQKELTDAKEAGRPFHIVHFDGHGIYADLGGTALAGWVAQLGSLMLGGKTKGPQGYLIFEHPGSKERVRPVPGAALGQLLHDSGVPVLVLNACQSAMHEALERPAAATDAHAEVRAIGSLAQAVVDQGIPAVLGMRYSVYVVTAAQYIGALYAALAKGRGLGQAASEARKDLSRNPERWVGLRPRPLQDWCVPVIYEAIDRPLLAPGQTATLSPGPDLDPVQNDPALRRYCPDQGFVGRDETLLMLDRAFDTAPVVLLHAYAGQGKTATAVEFARWYAQTGGLGDQPVVLLTSFEVHTDLTDALNRIGQRFAPILQANGIEWHSINDETRRRTLILQLLRLVPVLWIWDNLEPVAGFPAGAESAWTPAEQTELADFLKQIKLDGQTKAKLLLTSRRDEQAWLGGLPRRVRMPPMSAADAALLALELGRERGLERTGIGDWQPLLDYCAGNPLTLRVLIGQAVGLGLSGAGQIAAFVQAIRDGARPIADGPDGGDADAEQGRDRSLRASLDYGFAHAFAPAELPIVALLHLFQGVVDVRALALMGQGDHALPALQGQDQDRLTTLLRRAADIGLLTPLGGTLIGIGFGIHPALPWFLGQVFARCYDGAEGRPAAGSARRAWVEAVGALGDYYCGQVVAGHQEAIQPLALEESNLLHARRLARRQGWWSPVISAMQGLRVLYEYQGRRTEWSRLVAECVSDYCTADDGPVPGREDGYTLVMGYRVDLARQLDHDLARAADLQAKLVDWDRQAAAEALGLPGDAPLDADRRHRVRTLGASLAALGTILREQGSGDCIARYLEAIGHAQRIGDTAGEAITHFNLGHAYKDIPAIRDLDSAESAYRRSLDLFDPNDALNRSKCLQAIGMVHHQRFDAARARGEPESALLDQAQSAETHLQQALALCPAGAIADLGPMHNQLGALYDAVGQTERAREHYEQAVQLAERVGDRYSAGTRRFNLAVLYLGSAEREAALPRRRDLLHRAQAYAHSALRDFGHYQGRAADPEARAQQLIDSIAQSLAEPPPP